MLSRAPIHAQHCQDLSLVLQHIASDVLLWVGIRDVAPLLIAPLHSTLKTTAE